ncbi:MULTISPECIES: sodium:solute symporter family protein [Pontibacter]|uniref:Transporter, SSS family n=1 Tax=Pontibacter lucknowensis TaxID=1077936 RepID=A0A1N6ZCA3_9BACT|nr:MULTISPECIES: sodium:solute symporter family protein [Pontibacter]EJF09020.1 sodium solute transporter superfamily protein [Pontibacter sp. BAB1700]SIR24445.1 transporter, SSS family [Pontibacter lucknowensis]
MLLIFVILYLLFNMGVGFWASRRVHNTSDFLLAGRSLPFYISTAVVFATWFGSETLLGASSEFASHGLLGVIEDPFGAALCLVLVGLFFAKKLYRLNLLTIGDYYRIRYNRTTEQIAAFFMVISYFGWIAAQMVALGIVMNQVFGVSTAAGIIIGSMIVVGYTYMGGMWSVSITDFVQTVMIIGGLIFITYTLLQRMPLEQITATLPDGFFRMTPPDRSPTTWLNYFALWITIGLGSIPQQDVFQRVMSAKSEKVAVAASLGAGLLYLTVAFMPLLLALYARTLHPELLQEDAQLLVPGLIMGLDSMLIKVLFFGALISAIISTASGGILAPAAVLSENMLRPLLGERSDKQMLLLSRISVLVVAAVSLGMALLRSNIYELVSESSALSLVSLFVPLVAGLYWKRTSALAANASILAGMAGWLLCLYLQTTVNPMLYGLGASVAGLLVGQLISHLRAKPIPAEPLAIKKQV